MMNKPFFRKTQKIFFYLLIILVTLTSVNIVRVYAVEKNFTPIFENVKLSPDFTPDPMTIRGISGGFVTAAEESGRVETITGPCVGFVDEKPDHKMELTKFFQYLSLQVKSSEDTTLVVRGPGGSWCNDDYEGKNPGIVGQWLSGTYDIWVGSPQKNKYIPYIIRISQKSQ